MHFKDVKITTQSQNTETIWSGHNTEPPPCLLSASNIQRPGSHSPAGPGGSWVTDIVIAKDPDLMTHLCSFQAEAEPFLKSLFLDSCVGKLKPGLWWTCVKKTCKGVNPGLCDLAIKFSLNWEDFLQLLTFVLSKNYFNLGLTQFSPTQRAG